MLDRQFLFITTLITTKWQEKAYSGTGFFYQQKNPPMTNGQLGNYWLVTNRHVIYSDCDSAGKKHLVDSLTFRVRAEEKISQKLVSDPWAFNSVQYDSARQTLFVFAELTEHKKGNEETAQLLKDMPLLWCEDENDNWKRRGLTRDDRITADSAEPKSIADYNKFGLRCFGAEKGPGSVDYSMKWLQSLRSIVIDPKRCPETWAEFSSYQYEHSKDGEIISGYPDVNNHHIDAVRYATERIWRRPGNKAQKPYVSILGI